MADDFLSQDEVDALLKGVEDESSAVSEANQGSGADRTATTLMQSSYRSAALESISRWKLPRLSIINERFSQLFALGLQKILGANVRALSSPLKLCSYGEFAGTLQGPASLNLIRLVPLQGTALIVLDPDLVFVIIDHLFGGEGRLQEERDRRDLTHTEHRILKLVLGEIFSCYGKAWNPVHPIEVELIRSETDPKFVSIAAADDIVALSSFAVEFGSCRGQLHLCLPAAMLEPLRAKLAGPAHREATSADDRWLGQMSQQLQTAEVELVAQLSEVRVTLGDLMRMRPGDFIPLDMPETIAVFVEGVSVMGCSYGIANNQYALRIENLAAHVTPHLLTHAASSHD